MVGEEGVEKIREVAWGREGERQGETKVEENEGIWRKKINVG